jgi:hypothetical protein
MAEVLQILDGGIIKEKGKPMGVIRFLISTNEGAPEQLTGYCLPNYRDSIIKSLKRLVWQKPDPATQKAVDHKEVAHGIDAQAS